MDFLYPPRYCKGCDDLVADLDRFDFAAYLFDHTRELMSHDKAYMTPC